LHEEHLRQNGNIRFWMGLIMRQAIGTAPKDQEAIIIEDEVTGAFELVSWSSDATYWVKETGEPSKVTPTHWRPAPSYQRTSDQQAMGAPPDGGRATFDFLVAQVVNAPPARAQPRRPLRRTWIWILFAIIAVAISVAVGFRFDIKTSATRLAEWRTHSREFVARLFEQEGLQPPRPENTKASTAAEITAELPKAAAEEVEELRTVADAIPMQQGSQETEALKGQSDAARGYRDTNVTVSGQANEDLVQPKKTAETATIGLQQERKITDVLASDLDADHRVREATPPDQPTPSRNNAEISAMELQQEQQRTTALSAALAETQRDLEKTAAQATKAEVQMTDLKKANEATITELQQERRRTAELTGELAKANQELERIIKGSDEAEMRRTLATISAELQAERQRSSTLEDELTIARRDAAARSDKNSDASATTAQTERQSTASFCAVAPDHEPRNIDTQAASNVGTPRPRTLPPPNDDPEATRLIARATALIAQGNITQARIVLDRAVQIGSAKASFAIAETYDPHVLSNWKTVGTRADIATAREFYSRAAAGGFVEAEGRLESLR
jgi:hypothetical protein